MKKKYTIIDSIGIHARPASAIVNAASKFQSKIEIIQDENSANAKSIINLMALGVKCGSSIELNIIGPDEEDAFKSIESILKKEKLVA
ncbi:MAG: HPr family phosphocarrier protein [Mycoplasmoidaceae bacterium]